VLKLFANFSVIPAIQPNVLYFYSGAGYVMAACVTGLVGDVNPSDNRAIPETRTASGTKEAA